MFTFIVPLLSPVEIDLTPELLIVVPEIDTPFAPVYVVSCVVSVPVVSSPFVYVIVFPLIDKPLITLSIEVPFEEDAIIPPDIGCNTPYVSPATGSSV